ncbi:MAG TPA: hypothetical protein VNL17_05855 [Verrucomicrobiae bacterium]|nr:hypothetical protein [Verrucomicrobiae bacterium]
MRTTRSAILFILFIVGCGRQSESPSPLGKSAEWCSKHLGEPVDKKESKGIDRAQYLTNGITIWVDFNNDRRANRVSYVHDSSLPVPLTETEIQQFLRENSDNKKWTLHDSEEVAQRDAEELAHWKKERQRAVEEGDTNRVTITETMIRVKTNYTPRRRKWTREGASASCDDDRVVLSIGLNLDRVHE